MTLKLNDLIQAFRDQTPEQGVLVNLKNGEFSLQPRQTEAPADHDWLLSKEYFNELDVMARCVKTLPNKEHQIEIFRGLQDGQGESFFLARVMELGYLPQWEAYLNDEYRSFLGSWCDLSGLSYE